MTVQNQFGGRYGRCAKCGIFKEPSTNYECDECAGTPGQYRCCAVCGVGWIEANGCWVCGAGLEVWKPVHRPPLMGGTVLEAKLAARKHLI